MLRGYRSVDDVSFDLDGTFSTYVGWVLFEVGDKQHERIRGVIGTFNNYATLMLLRIARDQKPCRVYTGGSTMGRPMRASGRSIT